MTPNANCNVATSSAEHIIGILYTRIEILDDTHRKVIFMSQSLSASLTRNKQKLECFFVYLCLRFSCPAHVSGTPKYDKIRASFESYCCDFLSTYNFGTKMPQGPF